MQISSILCPVDFSEHAERALTWAAALASSFSAHLTLLTANDPLMDAAARATGTSDQLLQQTQDELRALLQKVQPDGGYSSWTMPAVSVEVGDPADVILAQAEDCKSDLVVMGTQGLGGARKFVFGSTTERVLRMTRVPVLAVPAGPDRVSRTPEGFTLNVNRVLLPVDPDQPVDPAVEAAGSLARKFRVPVRLLAVISAPPLRNAIQDAVAAEHARRAAQVRTALESVASKLGEGVQVELQVRSGKPSEQITHDAAEHGCGLIVMGSGVRHRPGATAYRVLCHADVPVLAVPATA